MATINDIQQAQKEITVDYPISEVKQAINLVFETLPSKYTKRESGANEMLGIYHFPVQNNLNPAIIDLSLSEIGENKTKIQSSIVNAGGSINSTSTLSGLLYNYLDNLSKALTGSLVVEIEEEKTKKKSKKKSKKKGCLWAILIWIAVTIIGAILVQ